MPALADGRTALHTGDNRRGWISPTVSSQGPIDDRPGSDGLSMGCAGGRGSAAGRRTSWKGFSEFFSKVRNEAFASLSRKGWDETLIEEVAEDVAWSAWLCKKRTFDRAYIRAAIRNRFIDKRPWQERQLERLCGDMEAPKPPKAIDAAQCCAEAASVTQNSTECCLGLVCYEYDLDPGIVPVPSTVSLRVGRACAVLSLWLSSPRWM